MRRELLLLAFAALLLVGCTYPAPPSPPPGSGAADFTDMWANNWHGIASIAILASAFVVSLAYMLGSFLNNTMLINWSKSELLQVFASALIVGGLFWLVAMIGAMSQSLTTATGINCLSPDLEDAYAKAEIALAPCHINVAQQYLQITYENLFEMTRDVLVTGSLISAISNFNITFESLPPPWISVTLVPFASLNMIFETLYFVFDMLTKLMILLKFQIYFFSFVWRALFPMLLVGGVILRTFWFTRRLGGLLIALAIGMYVAFPMIYTLAYWVLGGTSAGTYVIKIDPRDYADITSAEEYDYLFEERGYSFVNHIEQTSEDIAHRINRIENKNWVGDILSVGGTAFGAGVPGGPAVMLGVPKENNWVVGENGVLENTAKLLIYSTFVPFIALMATISFVKGLSPLLGGDVEIAGITHLI